MDAGDLGLCGADAVTLAGLLRRREVSAVEVVTAHVQRLEAVDGAVNAVVTRTLDRALDSAAALDAALAAGAEPGLLHGLPVAHKDLADTAGVRTTYGSTAFADHVPQRDAVHVARMAAAGALSLGKTNTPELGAGSQTFNRVFGATRNPWDLTRTPGGSSGGAAAALAGRTVALADGSDMGGSLRNPAAFCNVVGLRPTPGRVPEVPTTAWSPLSVVGPMARTVADVALLLAAVAGPDPRDVMTAGGEEGPFAAPDDVVALLDREPARPPRVAWSADLGGLPVDRRVREVLGALPAVLESLGWQVEEAEPDLAGADEVFATVRAHQYATSFEGLLRRHREHLKDTVVWQVEQGLALTGRDLRRASRGWSLLLERAGELWQRYDLMVAPVTQVPPFDAETEWVREVDGVPMDTYIQWMASCTRVSLLGAPALSLPAGFTPEGLPVGVQLVAAPARDWHLLRLARRLEAVTGHGARVPDLPAGAATDRR